MEERRPRHALVHRYGVKPGDRWGLPCATTRMDHLLRRILSIGAISVSLNAWWTEEELEYAINDSELSVLIADTERIERGAVPAPAPTSRCSACDLTNSRRSAPHVEHWHEWSFAARRCPRWRSRRRWMPPSSTRRNDGIPQGCGVNTRALCQTVFAFTPAPRCRRRRGPDKPQRPRRVLSDRPALPVTVVSR